MKIGTECNIKYQSGYISERLRYIGFNLSGNGYWHQFELIETKGVWCEMREEDFHTVEIREQSRGTIA